MREGEPGVLVEVTDLTPRRRGLQYETGDPLRSRLGHERVEDQPPNASSPAARCDRHPHNLASSVVTDAHSPGTDQLPAPFDSNEKDLAGIALSDLRQVVVETRV